MTNQLIVLFLSVTAMASCSEFCASDKPTLMLPAPEEVYRKTFDNVTLPPVIFNVPTLKIHDNSTLPVAYFAPKSLKKDESIVEDNEEDEIHKLSLKIAGFISQCLVFLFVFSIVTMDVEQFEETLDGEIIVHKLRKAREVQPCPLPSRQNVVIIRREVQYESDC